MHSKKTLKELFDSKKLEIEQEMQQLKLPSNADKVQQIVTNYLNELIEKEGEFRQSLTESEDYILQAALSMLKAQQEMSFAIINQFSQSGLSNGSKDNECTSSHSQHRITQASVTPLQSLVGSSGGALLGKVILGGWGAVFGAIAGTAIAIYIANQMERKKSTVGQRSMEGEGLTKESDKPIDAQIFVDIISEICESIDNLISTFRAQINRVVIKYESFDKASSLEQNYLPIVESMQQLLGYSRTHCTDENFNDKIQVRIEQLTEVLGNYGLEVVDYSESDARWFEEFPSNRVSIPKMVFPAIVKNNSVILKGRIFVPTDNNTTS